MAHKLTKAERTKQFIIQTSAGIFNTKGYAGTSISDLTEATGLTKGSIYGNFETKEDIALAAFSYNHAAVNQIIEDALAKATSFYGKLESLVEVYEQFDKSPFPLGGCPILNTAIEADDTNPLLREKATTALFDWKNSIENLIVGGIKAGEFRQVENHEQLALSIIALIEGGLMIAKLTVNQKYLCTVMKTVKELIGQLRK